MGLIHGTRMNLHRVTNITVVSLVETFIHNSVEALTPILKGSDSLEEVQIGVPGGGIFRYMIGLRRLVRGLPLHR